MKVVLQFRHEDGRVVEVKEVTTTRVEVWQIYPVRELLDKAKTLDAARELVPEGFAPDAIVFSPPCPKCNELSPMTLDTGMYVCRECHTQF